MNWYLVVYILSVIIVYFTTRSISKDDIKSKYISISTGDLIGFLLIMFMPLLNTLLAVVGLVMGIISFISMINKDSILAKKIALKMFFIKEEE